MFSAREAVVLSSGDECTGWDFANDGGEAGLDEWGPQKEASSVVYVEEFVGSYASFLTVWPMARLQWWMPSAKVHTGCYKFTRPV